MFYAHSNGPDKAAWQTLHDHLLNTACIARELTAGTKLQNYAWIAALLHDLGKYSSAFQDRLAGKRIRVDHSSAGVHELEQRFFTDPKDKIKAMILSYCIAGHHGGLPDYGDPTDVEQNATLWGKRKKKIEDYQNYQTDLDISNLTLPVNIPIKPDQNQIGFSLAFFTRMVYSALVDADFLDTETFMNGGKKPRGGYPEIQVLCDRFNQYLQKFNHPQNQVNRQRTQTLQQCVQKAALPAGLFTLTVPTGGGKTLASMAFALNHAVRHNLKRIIYVIPFTTIIEQNAGVFKSILGEDLVLEHHSNFEWNPTISEGENTDNLTNTTLGKMKLAAENWDIPVVVTTNVQFFESIFSNKPSRCRKLHNLANSVVIFDEAQMLPKEFLQPCMSALHELVRNYGVSAVFCTATQPTLDRFFPPGTKFQELADSPQALYQFYRRVQVLNLGRLTDEELLERIEQHPQALCIVNTRKHASGLYKSLPGEGRFHLSTLMCPAHRRQTISEIRMRLASQQSCRVISTQIMEAGIDVDFPIGFRALAGLDSIIQAAGRVNREGRQTTGQTFVFEPDTPLIRRTPAYIQQGAEISRTILNEFEDPISLAAIQTFFSRLYSYRDLQDFDAFGILNCFSFDGKEPVFNFALAAEKFRLIQANTFSIIIRFNDQVDQILSAVNPEAYQIPRKLQPYVVNIYQNEFENLQAKGLLDSIGKFSVLNDLGYYDPFTGLVLVDQETTAIFIDN